MLEKSTTKKDKINMSNKFSFIMLGVLNNNVIQTPLYIILMFQELILHLWMVLSIYEQQHLVTIPFI
jgi:hypothetical protein